MMNVLMRKIIAATLLAAIPLVSPATAGIITTDRAVEGHNKFAVELYQAMGAGEGNLFFSPLSISTAFSMAFAGAAGETAQEMKQVMHFPTYNEDLHGGNSLLLAKLKNSNVLQANSLWPGKNEQVLISFIQRLQRHYRADYQPLDFAAHPKKSKDTINKWVNEKTLGRIQKLLQPGDITYDTRLVLTNAIVFTGKWKQAFDPDKTARMLFHLADGGEVWTQGMVKKTHLMIAEVDGSLVFEIPFEGDKTSLIIALPNKANGLADLEKSLNPEKIKTWISKMSPQEFTLTLPRIEMDERADLADIMIKMGMSKAFSAEADFSGMTGERGLFISKVIHQATLKINEEGVEAAAATALTFKRSAMTRRLTVDRPFMFMIRHKETGSILFMGRMSNPAP